MTDAELMELAKANAGVFYSATENEHGEAGVLFFTQEHALKCMKVLMAKGYNFHVRHYEGIVSYIVVD